VTQKHADVGSAAAGSVRDGHENAPAASGVDEFVRVCNPLHPQWVPGGDLSDRGRPVADCE
jgi:hypothetical protein